MSKAHRTPEASPAPTAPTATTATTATDPVARRHVRRESRREQSRSEIVEAARRVFLRRGLANTTLDAVAAEAGLTKAALYYYFPSKDALLFEVVYPAFEGQSCAIQAAVREAKGGGDALRAIIRETVQ